MIYSTQYFSIVRALKIRCLTSNDGLVASSTAMRPTVEVEALAHYESFEVNIMRLHGN